MRDIKFRLWCSNKNEWERGEWLIAPNGLLIEMKFGRNVRISNKTHLLSQYSGFKDKNDKEVYEGDIAEYYSLLSGEKELGVVTFENGCFHIGECYLHRKRITVIGNIYENKDLI